jgi:sulfhydrogenase subunit beta (sulfur reductase)
MRYLSINKEEWDVALERLLSSYTVFATISNGYGLDYEVVTAGNIRDISYDRPKPATPLKTFFLPVRENVTSGKNAERQRIILGIPNCDIKGLGILDEIYLDKDYTDIYYRERRENTLLISSDCFDMEKNCHCSSYGIKPYSEDGADLAVIQIDDHIILRVITPKGEEFSSQLTMLKPAENGEILNEIEKYHKAVESLLSSANKALPDFETTGKLVSAAGGKIWEKYSSHCVSCGACTTICPTCSCFLLIDRPGFEKIKQMDACQYPGFERTAGGGDSLFELSERFRNRYLCKYVWKSRKFRSTACTGCGRCIEACLGKISKNELFTELTHASQQ